MDNTNQKTSRIISILGTTFPAFQSYNYRLYFLGQFISAIGTWLQILAEGWLVLQMTHSALWVGIVAALETLPVLLFSLFGGVIVDRFQTQKLLIITNTASMLLATIFGILIVAHLITLPLICILAFLLGTVDALDKPGRQAFVREMVDKDRLSSAVALNSGMFNAARVIGPSAGGLLINIFGIGGTFILNGISYIPAIVALYKMELAELPLIKDINPLKAIKEGLHYAANHPAISILLFLSTVVTIFGWSYTTILSVVVENVYHKGAGELGYLYAVIGVGAILGAILISILGKKVSSTHFILTGLGIFSVAIIAFSFVTNIYIALPFLFMVGIGLIVQFSTINTTIQHLVPDSMRGRVMGIYTVTFMGFAPFGSFQIGYIAEHWGSLAAIRFGGIIVLLFGVFLYTRRHKLEEDIQKHYIRD